MGRVNLDTQCLHPNQSGISFIFSGGRTRHVQQSLSLDHHCQSVCCRLGLRSIWPKSGSAPAVILILGVGVTAVSLPPASHALQIIQQEDPVIVAASQSIDDTLLITTTDATVHGGDIKGSLFVAAEDVKVTGVIPQPNHASR